MGATPTHVISQSNSPTYPYAHVQKPKSKSRPRAPTIYSFMRVPQLSVSVIKNRPSIPFGLGKKCRPGVSDRETKRASSFSWGSSRASYSASESGSETRPSSMLVAGYTPYVAPHAAHPPTPVVPVPALGTKILERFWPEDEPSIDHRDPFRGLESDRWRKSLGGNIGHYPGSEKDVPPRISMLAPPPSRQVSRVPPFTRYTTAVHDIPLRWVFVLFISFCFCIRRGYADHTIQ
ncbi:hypothetical protein ID866_8045 [Astraeus odoratus]|nr:hypothetical protein ID866_8045 [Astraeus odoratus]